MSDPSSSEVASGLGEPSVAPPLQLVLETKLHPPPQRAAWVARQRLVDVFDEAARRPIVLVSAPAGYGKTTVAAQWLADSKGSRATAWVALDDGDNDPARLWTHVAVALDRAGCAVSAELATSLAAPGGELVAGALPRLLGALSSAPDEVVILLDDFQCITNPACHDQVSFLVEHLPHHVHLVILTRVDPGLKLGRLRASGLLGEIRADALRFTEPEAASLLSVENVALRAEGVSELLATTEGWPAGLYLAALALARRPDADEQVHRFDGSHRSVADYFSEEVLSGHPEPVRRLILEISVLDRFCAALCDHVVETTGSAAVLRELERANLFLVPLDDEGRWFRFHHLFAAVVRSHLEVLHPERVPVLHRRAAEWFRLHHHVDEAVTHLLAAGDTGCAADLVQKSVIAHLDGGRAHTLRSWLDGLGTGAISRHPSAGVAAAWVAAITGDQAVLARHLDDLAPVLHDGPLPDGTHSVESAVALVHGMFGYDGPLPMMSGASRAAELETDARTIQYAMAQRSLGHAAYVLGDLAAAMPPLLRAVHSDAALPMVRLAALGDCALVNAELGRHDVAAEMADQAMRIADEREVYAMPQARSLAFTALGQSQAAAGKLAEAMVTLEEGWALRRRLPTIGPWPGIHHLLVMARVAVELDDLGKAQHLLDELAARTDRWTEGMAAMHARVAVVRAAFRERLRQDPLEEPLTGRELDVLRLLQGTLSLTEIAAVLHLSANTVKTHVQALYRKLGAHSRTDAVAVARRRQLI
ncbi:LuxR C-terminal-related transcriptional regulator [Nocardioides sp. S-58]|uniref:LuxR C-terminal-related transcriptional regulator n=1 Tax=Nocardioides renjunii TaxID=3095075 RepID=A0ABU5KB78_9ACTN|nr:LuxR C-terminal-related transcriptional regulator [Nocardioides sp. S-58]MDZ5662191.1 LuxR C-terminal-related transcriptional regulator [Nocardioides sp. S-58]